MNAPDFSNFPVLQNERILLRRIVPTDSVTILALRSNKQAMTYVPRPLMNNEEEAFTFIDLLESNLAKGAGINWGICLKENDKLVGNICHFNLKLEDSRSEIGYMLHPDYFGQGIMKEAIALVLDYGFNELKFHATEAIILDGNTASKKVAEYCGFIHEGTMREAFYHNEMYHNVCMYSVLASEYQNKIN